MHHNNFTTEILWILQKGSHSCLKRFDSSSLIFPIGATFYGNRCPECIECFAHKLFQTHNKQEYTQQQSHAVLFFLGRRANCCELITSSRNQWLIWIRPLKCWKMHSWMMEMATLHALEAWVRLHGAGLQLIGLAKSERDSESLPFVSLINSTACS